MIVTGIDSSLTSAGVGILNNTQPVHNSHHGYSGHNGATYQTRSRRIRWTCGQVTQAATSHGTPDLVAMEQHPSGVKVSAHEFDRAALWHAIYGYFDARNIPVAVIHPTTLKCWTTGSGRASKTDVIETIELWCPGIELACDDEADALALAFAGAFHLGDPMPFEVKPRHTTGLEAVQWPN